MVKAALVLLLLLLSLTSCTTQPATTPNTPDGIEENVPATGATVPATGATPATDSSSAEVGGYAELISGLEGTGATVEEAGNVEQPFFSVPGKVIRVNGKNVQVFAYESEEIRQGQSSQISSDGSAIGTSMVGWMDQPNFWAKGKLIVFYLGKDQETINQISQVMGSAITQP